MMKNYYSAFYVLLTVLCILVFFPVLNNQFQLRWDDQWQIMNHYTSRGFTWNNLMAIFSDSYYGQYSPVNQLFYTLIYYFFGYNPLLFHLYSLLLHITNTCLVFLIIYRILTWGKYRDENTSIIVAFFVALLFGIHPMQVEAVAWISSSKVVLYSFFTLWAFLCYLKYIKTYKIRYYLLTMVLFFFSFGSKEESVIIPVSLIILDWVMKRNMSKKSVWIEKIPFILFALFLGIFTLSIQSARLIEEWAGYTFPQRLVFACYAIVEYVVKLVLPVNLLYIYPFPVPPGEALPLRMFIYPFIILIATVWILSARKQLPLIFGIVFFLVNIALSLHIVPMSRYTIVADRYIYLPSIGLFFIGVWYVVSFLQTQIKKRQKLYYVIIALYLLYLGIYAHQRTKVWYDNNTLKHEIQELLQERI